MTKPETGQPAAKRSPAQNVPPLIPNPNKTILVVEDNQAMNIAICDILEMHGFQVLSASDGMEGFAAMNKQRPDLVICDIMMPRLDGYGLLRRARNDEQLRTLPFIFLTARSSAQDRREAKIIGVEDYLIKPVNSQDLLLAISNVLRREEYSRAQTQQQMELLRNEIVSALQHEFRTPLTFILGYAELIAEGASEEIDLETLRISTAAILEGGRRLKDMIENFLLLADVQYRQALPDSAAPVDLARLLAQLALEFQKSADEAGLSFTLDSDIQEPLVLAEVPYLHAAIRKLIENAIQYRSPESALIGLSVTARDNYLGVHVIDDGRGIPKDKLDSLRTPFSQIDRQNRIQPGAGLGLALAKQVAHLHGGEMQIESEMNQGSKFTIWLPQYEGNE